MTTTTRSAALHRGMLVLYVMSFAAPCVVWVLDRVVGIHFTSLAVPITCGVAWAISSCAIVCMPESLAIRIILAVIWYPITGFVWVAITILDLCLYSFEGVH